MRRISVLSVVSAVLMAVPSVAAGQGAPSDPEADSPSGVVYEIPAEQGREDAAPKDRTRQSQGGRGGSQAGGDPSAGGATPETSIRSENNFGTSSNVPGAGSEDRGAPDRGEKSEGRSAGQRDKGSSVKDVASEAARSTAASTEGPSDEVVFPLIVVLVAAGGLIGVVASRRALRGRG